MIRMAAGVFIVDDWPGDVWEETEATEEMEATEETSETEETENFCYFFCPMCLKEYRKETEPGNCHEIVCACGNLVLFGRASDRSGLVMYLLF